MQLATVTAASPLRVRIDGALSDSEASGPVGQTYTATTRVLVEVVGRQVFVVGDYVAPSGQATQEVYLRSLGGFRFRLIVSDAGALGTEGPL